MNTYFTRREPPDDIDFESSYWGTVVDPDGNIRDRLEERDQCIEDMAQELSFLNRLNPGRILDVGCGPGYLLSAIGSNWEKHGVELSRTAATHALKWGEIRTGELHDAGYPSGYFDVVVMYYVIEHVMDPVGVIHEVFRILRPGGSMLFATPDFDSGCARLFGENYRILKDRTHISLFTNDSAHRFLRDHGFIIDRVEYPFFETRHFTVENLMRLFDTSKISPPFYGNLMSFYCHKPDRDDEGDNT